MKKEGFKRGQVTIFIIISIIIIAAALLIFFLVPGVKESVLGTPLKSPESFITECLSEPFNANLSVILSQGGELNPAHSYLYQGEKIAYACYTGEYYQPCIVEKPLLKKSIEKEIQNGIKEASENCFKELENEYKSQGYSVSESKNGELSVRITPRGTAISFPYELTLTKEETKKVNPFNITYQSNLYKLIFIATSIIEWEATYGDSETTFYMDNYHDVKVEKLKQSDGTKIYIITDRNSGESLKFASRGLSYPPGYPNIK